MSRTLVDPETGQLYEVASFTTVEQQKGYEKAKQKEAVKLRSNSPFVLTEMDAFKGVLSTLTNKELGYFLILQTYIDYKNMIKITPDSKAPMSKKEIAEVLQIKSDKTLRSILKKLQELELLHMDKVELYGKSHKAYFISSDYCFRKGVGSEYSNKKTDNAVKVFLNSLQSVYADGNIQPADIGFIYKVIPYIHYDSNMLTVNPNERDHSKVTFFSIDSLANEIGLSREETAKKIASIVWDGKYVFARTKVGNISHFMIMVNPFVLYRKAGEPEGIGYEFYVTPSNKSGKFKK